jgi:hypothetical protein
VTQGGDITYKIAQAYDSRSLFQTNGTLDNQTDPNFRSISPNFTVFGIARNLGTIQAMQDPIVWAVGFITEPAINYTDPSGASQKRSLFYKTQYSDDTSLVSIHVRQQLEFVYLMSCPKVIDFLDDFSSASSRAQQLDSKILQEAASISGLLGDLVALATAQVYGSTQLTVGTDASGNFNKSDVMAFMKNVGGSKAK